MTDSIKIRDLITDLGVVALDRAEMVNGGNSNYPYAFGFLISLVQSVACDMELSNKQLDTIQECIDYWNKVNDCC